MNPRYGATICASLGVTLLAACASAPPRPPAPLEPDATAITIQVNLRLPVQEWLKSADVMATIVYFVKACPPPSPPCEEKLIPSNHESQGRVYLLNAEPGEYWPVAAAYQTAVFYGIGAAHAVNIAYLPDAAAREAAVQVLPGRIADAGRYRVRAVEEVCPDTADPGQLRHAERMEPGVRKCGIVASLIDSFRRSLSDIGSRPVYGNKAFPHHTGANHFRGVSHETLCARSDAKVIEEARRELEAAGWSFDARP